MLALMAQCGLRVPLLQRCSLCGVYVALLEALIGAGGLAAALLTASMQCLCSPDLQPGTLFESACLCAGRSPRMLSCSRARLRLALAALGTLASVASASQWVVETNSFRIREPASARGDYDAAIGDVRPQFQPHRPLLFYCL